jgi:hypothetical protein
METLMAKRVRTTSETSTGRNVRFKDPARPGEMSRSQFVKEIEQGNYPDYHVRKMNGVKTPCSNPDGSEGNNLD